LRVSTWDPDLATQRLHRRSVDHRANDRVLEWNEFTVLWRVALEHDVRESLVIAFVDLTGGRLDNVAVDLDTHGFETSEVSKVITP